MNWMRPLCWLTLPNLFQELACYECATLQLPPALAECARRQRDQVELQGEAVRLLAGSFTYQSSFMCLFLVLFEQTAWS